MDTKKPLQTDEGSGISREVPAMDSSMRDHLAAYLIAIRPSSVDLEVPGVRLRLWYVALTAHFHAEYSFFPDDMTLDDDSIIEECSPILSDLLASIQEISAASYAALYDQMIIDFRSQPCYHKLTRS